MSDNNLIAVLGCVLMICLLVGCGIDKAAWVKGQQIKAKCEQVEP